MKVTFTIPDDTYDELKTIADKENKNVNALLLWYFTEFSDITPSTRYLLFSGVDLNAFESAIGLVSSTPEQVMERLKKLATVSIGSTEVILSDAEQDELKRRAERNNRKPSEELAFAFTLVKPMLFG